MSEGKKFADEVMSDEDLEKVSGGTREETLADGNELYKRGLLMEDQVDCPFAVHVLLHQMGYKGYQYKRGRYEYNIYTDKSGNQITRKQFWENFDAENATKPERGDRIFF